MKGLEVIIGVGVAGVFVGALAAEIVRRNPNMIKDIGNKTKRTFGKIAESFMEGYHGISAKGTLSSGD